MIVAAVFSHLSSEGLFHSFDWGGKTTASAILRTENPKSKLYIYIYI